MVEFRSSTTSSSSFIWSLKLIRFRSSDENDWKSAKLEPGAFGVGRSGTYSGSRIGQFSDLDLQRLILGPARAQLLLEVQDRVLQLYDVVLKKGVTR